MSVHTKKRIPPHRHFKDEIDEAKTVRPNRPPYKGVHATDVIVDGTLPLSETLPASPETQGTSFPPSPVNGQFFLRTDQGILYRYWATGADWIPADYILRIDRIAQMVRNDIHFTQYSFPHTFTGFFQHKDPDVTHYLHYMTIELITANAQKTYGYPLFKKECSPEFKEKIKIENFQLDTEIKVGLGASYNQPFGFSMNQIFVLSSRKWTVNRTYANHLGLHSSSYAEQHESTPKGTTNKLILDFSKVKDGSATSIVKTSYTITEGTKTLISKSFNLGIETTVEDGYALFLSVLLEVDGVPKMDTMQWWISSPVKEFVIPSGNSITVHVWVQVDGSDVHYWYGYTNNSMEDNSHLIFNFLHCDFLHWRGTQHKAMYPCKTVDSTEEIVFHARWNETEEKYYWGINETEPNFLHSDNVFALDSIMLDGIFELYADATGTEKLTVYSFMPQLQWL